MTVKLISTKIGNFIENRQIFVLLNCNCAKLGNFEHFTTCSWGAVFVAQCSYHTQWTAGGFVFGFVCLWSFCLCMKYLGNCWTNLSLIHMEDVFGPSLGRVWRSGSKVKGQDHQGQKTAFLTLLAACMRFMFDKTSLASSNLLMKLVTIKEL